MKIDGTKNLGSFREEWKQMLLLFGSLTLNLLVTSMLLLCITQR